MTTTVLKSKGHLGWTTSLEGNRMEVYYLHNGDIAWAPVSCVLEIGGPNDGRRIGRWLCTKEAWPVTAQYMTIE